MASDPSPAVTTRVQRSLEGSVTTLTIAAGLPAGLSLLYLLWRDDYSFEVRWTATTVVLVTWLGAAALNRQRVVRLLQLVANLLGALREGDYSIRGVGARPGSAVDGIMAEVNALGDTLQRQRAEAVESTALLSSVVATIDVAVFTFDPDERLRLVNRAGEKLLGGDAESLLGRRASEIGFEPFLAGETPRLIERPFGSARGRMELRRSTFRKDGRPHQLVVFADLSRALREEEQQAWQRIVRVLSHEINNSLTPIKSIAHSLRRILDRVPDVPRAAEIQEGLSLIETRSGALGRFLRSYAQLARLPKPQPRPVSVGALVHRIVELEKRLPVAVAATADVRVQADQDQLEQLLINIVRNAVDAALETSGGVTIGWRAMDGHLELAVEDEGRGLPDTSNLFVPFFTTKPNGSGIGLALSRQIAEAHGGTLRLENRDAGPGCRAILNLPLGSDRAAA
jgi:PAS domain S-box-containing protein